MYKHSRKHSDWPNLGHMSNCANPFGWMLGIRDWPDGSKCLRLMLWSQEGEGEGEMLPRQMHRCASHTSSQCHLPPRAHPSVLSPSVDMMVGESLARSSCHGEAPGRYVEDSSLINSCLSAEELMLLNYGVGEDS